MSLLRLTLLILVVISLIGCNNNSIGKKESSKDIYKMEIQKETFGSVYGKEVYLYSLRNNNGVIVKITNYGGIVTSILAPDKNGKIDDVVLGYDNLEGYLENAPYFGAIIGRYANRIAKGKFAIDSEVYDVAINNGTNSLHGGIKGFDKVIWEAEKVQAADYIGIQLHYLSTDGEEGYPGNLDITVQYTLNKNNELRIEYSATTDKSTVLNLTHHSYFNLAGTSGQIVLNHKLQIDADRYTVVDETQIPTGELRSVTNSPMDFRNPITIGSRMNEVEGGYDHNYVLNNSGEFAKVAEVSEPISGRVMQVFTTEPGMQVYTGNFLDGTIIGKQGISYKKHFGLCLETQHFPDSPNHPEFPNTILRPGEKYEQKTVYRFGVR